MPSRRADAAADASIGEPAKTIEPSVTGCTPEIARNSVVLPAPFEPTSVTISPSRTSSEMPCSDFDAAVAAREIVN